MRISDWSSDVCSSDLDGQGYAVELPAQLRHRVGGLEDDTRVGGSLEEQPNRRLIDRPGGGQGQRSEGHDRLARELQRRARSEELRVGKECVSPLRSRWSAYHKKKKETKKKSKA